MKQTRNLLFLLMALAVAVVPSAVKATADGLNYSKDHPLIVGLDADFAPLQYVDEEGMPHGYDVDFTRMLMKRLGIPFTYSPNTWEKIAGDVLHGRVDLGMMIYSDYRKDSTNYSRAVFRMYYQIVYRKADADTFDPRNLKDKRVAYMKSRPVGEMLGRMGAVKESLGNLDKAMEGLASGRYDAVICFRYQARYFITHYQMDDLVAEELSLQPREYCYVSHSLPLISLINDELKRMEAEGIVDDVYGKDIKSQFGSIEIPLWVWYLLGTIVLLSLVVASAIRYRAQKRLEAEHAKLLKAYDLLAEKNEALLLANGRAEESSRMKGDFIKQISHEIRTPLNAVSGFTQILTSPSMRLDEATRRDAGRQITENTERITKLVNKMLELSEASSQTVLERKDSVTVGRILNMAVESSGIREATHVAFCLEADEPTASTVLQTHGPMAARALSLLLDNAKKFTKEGTVTLKARPDGQQLLMVVEDTGIGIPAEEAEHVFEEFVQLDEYYAGTGIGLTVARSIARRLGGDISLDTSYEGGARFVFALPLS